MTTSLDPQPLYCRNKYYKQFISVYQLIFNIYQISRNTQALGHNPISHLSPFGKVVTDCTNSKINKQKVLNYSESQDPCP